MAGIRLLNTSYNEVSNNVVKNVQPNYDGIAVGILLGDTYGGATTESNVLEQNQAFDDQSMHTQQFGYRIGEQVRYTQFTDNRGWGNLLATFVDNGVGTFVVQTQ